MKSEAKPERLATAIVQMSMEAAGYILLICWCGWRPFFAILLLRFSWNIDRALAIRKWFEL